MENMTYKLTDFEGPLDLLLALIEKNKMNIENVKTNDSLKDFINENLTESQTEKLKEVLSDENKTKELLNSDLAKQLFKKLTGGDFNGRP